MKTGEAVFSFKVSNEQSCTPGLVYMIQMTSIHIFKYQIEKSQKILTFFKLQKIIYFKYCLLIVPSLPVDWVVVIGMEEQVMEMCIFPSLWTSVWNIFVF